MIKIRYSCTRLNCGNIKRSNDHGDKENQKKKETSSTRLNCTRLLVVKRATRGSSNAVPQCGFDVRSHRCKEGRPYQDIDMRLDQYIRRPQILPKPYAILSRKDRSLRYRKTRDSVKSINCPSRRYWVVKGFLHDVKLQRIEALRHEVINCARNLVVATTTPPDVTGLKTRQ